MEEVLCNLVILHPMARKVMTGKDKARRYSEHPRCFGWEDLPFFVTSRERHLVLLSFARVRQGKGTFSACGLRSPLEAPFRMKPRRECFLP